MRLYTTAFLLSLFILHPFGVAAARAGSLFNLKDDLSEKHDVSAQYPGKVKELTKMMEAFMEEVAENSRPIGTMDEG